MSILKNYQDKWEKRSTIRTRPRVIFNSEETGFFYPVSHQPLCAHPKIQLLSEEDFQFLLTQSLYKYCNDIAVIETKIVNKSAFDVINDRLPVVFNADIKMGAFTIMLDEVYHAYVAFDALNQIQIHTHIEPLPLPKIIEIEKAINMIKSRIDKKYHKSFELVAVCIAENTLTQDTVTMVDKEETHPFFQQIIKDHLTDESRHCGYFIQVLAYFWKHLSEEYKLNIGEQLADFIESYLGVDIEIDFNKKILASLNFSDEEIARIISETYVSFKISSQHHLLKNIITQLNKTELLQDINVINNFKKKNWI